MKITIEESRDFVNKNSPASNANKREYLSWKLMEICEDENESPERAWTIESYWDIRLYK